MFSGREYHRAFEEAVDTLPLERDPHEVRSELVGLEWILWRAIRGALVQIAFLVSAMAVFLPYLLEPEKSWASVGVAFAVAALLATALYWIFRLIFWAEVTYHVKGRKFGEHLSM